MSAEDDLQTLASQYESELNAYREVLETALAALLISESAYETDDAGMASCAVCGGNPHAQACEVYNAIRLIEPLLGSREVSGYEIGDGVQVRCIPIAEWRIIRQWIEDARSALESAYYMPHKTAETFDAIRAALQSYCLLPPERK